mgnify:CR=1 FL=1
MTLDEISEYISALHGETKPMDEFSDAVYADRSAQGKFWTLPDRTRLLMHRDRSLLMLTIRALRNQGQPYYDKVQP